jgi:hypothetical protein
MQILFVDGIGGARLWRGALLRRLGDAGHKVSLFSYLSFVHDRQAIQASLAEKITRLACYGDYALVGYSFGGVLVRAALQDAAAGLAPPRHLFLLGSPIRSMRLSRRFGGCVAYRVLTGDCGQLLRSPSGMRNIGLPSLPTTCIVGTRGGAGRFIVGARASVGDGMVTEAESCPARFADVLHLPTSHAALPAHPGVAAVITQRLACWAWATSASRAWPPMPWGPLG